MPFNAFGFISGLVMLIIGSLKSPSLRANHKLPLWKANDAYGRLALVGMIFVTLVVVAGLFGKS